MCELYQEIRMRDESTFNLLNTSEMEAGFLSTLPEQWEPGQFERWSWNPLKWILLPCFSLLDP